MNVDDQLAKWQTSFKQATPKVDVAALIEQTNKAQRALKMKAAVDLLLGVAVSLFCLYAMFFKAETSNQMLLFAVLAPVPLGFGIWGYKFRQTQLLTDTLDTKAMLDFKQHQLVQRVTYWKVSLYGFAVLWTALLAVSLYNFIVVNAYLIWTVQLAINSVLLLFVYWRYVRLKKQLPQALANIDAMR
ncbi:MAG: hypothetical protein VX078_19385 [Pseudomonadota bacterium]|nr:hypothetical protein [Pseudomonadota bacterium]